MSSNNEELAIKAQNGDKNALLELWESVKLFIYKSANRYYLLHRKTADGAGVTVEDLTQSGFIALCDTVKAFDMDKGYKFLTYLPYSLKNRFNELCGIRTNKRDPLLNCASLDEPIDEETGEGTRLDLVADEAAAFENNEINKEFSRELHVLLDECLDCLPGRGKQAIQMRYYDCLSIESIAEQLNISRDKVTSAITQGQRRMLAGKHSPRLKAFYSEMSPYRGTGYTAFTNYQASSVERFVERLEQFRNGKQ